VNVPSGRSLLVSAVLAAALMGGGALYALARAGDDGPEDAAGTGGRPGRCVPAVPRASGALSGSFGEKLTVVVPRGDDEPPPPGTTLGRRLPTGAVYAKILWRRDRRAAGRLRVTGRRLDAEAGRLRVRIGQGQEEFVPSALTFSSEGCWEVTARSGRVQARYVVRVVDHARGE
jgi:hypothetical protein